MNSQATTQESSNPSPKQPNNNQIIGKPMSLITKAEMRYEGVLFEVDRVNKTMSLKNVKQMGTEGRRGGEHEIPGVDKPLGTVKFRVDLVKTFKIIEMPEEEKQEEEEVMDPAIIESQDVPQDAESNAQAGESGENDGAATSWQRGTKVVKDQQLDKTQSSNDDAALDIQEIKTAGTVEKQPRKDPRENVYHSHKNSKPRTNKDDAFSAEVSQDQNEFDFQNRRIDKPHTDQQSANESSNAQDNGESPSVANKEEPVQNEGQTRPKYDKNNDFFDQLTNSTQEPQNRRGNNRGYGGNGRGRGGYRGTYDGESRGGYRGRGRGGNFYGDDENRRGGYNKRNEQQSRGGGRNYGNKYSDKLLDPNDPNYNNQFNKTPNEGGDGEREERQEEKGFFDKPKSYGAGGRGRGRDHGGEFRGRGNNERGNKNYGNNERGGRGGRPATGKVDQDKRDEETFGEVSSQNFKFNHENKRGGGWRRGRGNSDKNEGHQGHQAHQAHKEGGGHGIYGRGVGRGGGKKDSHYGSGGGGYSQAQRDPVVEDGHADFFDTKKKKDAANQKSSNRFAGINKLNKKHKKNESIDSNDADLAQQSQSQDANANDALEK